MATTTKTPHKKRGPNLGGRRDYPPVDNCSPAEWAWRTRSPVYRRKIGKSIRAVNNYLLLTRGAVNRGVTGTQRDFCHLMLDELRDDRRERRRPDRGVATTAATQPTKGTEALTNAQS